MSLTTKGNHIINLHTMFRTIIFTMIVLVLSIYAGIAYAEDSIAAPVAEYKGNVANETQYLTLVLPDDPDEALTDESQEPPEIYYTLNGSMPDIESDETIRYDKSIAIDKTMTVKYCSYSDGEMSNVESIDFTYLKPVKIKKISYKAGKKNKITIKWNRDKNAQGYNIYRKEKNKSKYNLIKTIKGSNTTKYTDSKIKRNKTYTYYISSYKDGVESKGSSVKKTVKTKHKHNYKLKSRKCSTGVQKYVCETCGSTKKKTVKKGSHKKIKTESGYYTVEKCKWCGKKFDKYLSKKIPSYWEKNIVSALDTAKKRADMPGYVYLTDPHWDDNAKNSPAIVSFVAKKMGYGYAICGGDVISTHHDKKSAAIKEIKSFYSKFSVPVLSLAGNHDYNTNTNTKKSSYLSKADVEKYIYSHNPTGTVKEYDGDFSYIDDTENKVRYITFYYDELESVPKEITDCISARVKELDPEWNVVLFSHAYWHFTKPGKKPVPLKRGEKLAAKILKIQEKSQANIVLWHVGHIHRDKKAVLKNANGAKVLVVATHCDTYAKSKPWGGLKMTKGKNTEQVVEIVQIDKNAKKIYLTRIGAGKSRSYSFD